MLVELLKPMGPELARRWLATLLAVPSGEREAVVEAIEARVAKAYAGRMPEPVATAKNHARRPKGGKSLDVVQPPVQRDGYTEQVVTTYEVEEAPAVGAAKKKRRA